MILVGYNWLSDSYPAVMCVCRLRELSGRLKRAGCHGKGRRKNIDGRNRISEMFAIEMIKGEFFDNGFRLSRPFRNKSN